MRTAILILLFSALSGVAQAECRHFDTKPPADPHVLWDGPGMFGALDRTMTLDCLSYIRFEIRHGRRTAVLRDDRRIIYRLHRGDPIGAMDAESVRKINRSHLEIYYVEPDGRGGYVERSLVLPRVHANKSE